MMLVPIQPQGRRESSSAYESLTVTPWWDISLPAARRYVEHEPHRAYSHPIVKGEAALRDGNH